MQERFEISEWRVKMGESPAIAPFMPVVQYEIESDAFSTRQRLFEAQAESVRFLTQCQQQAITAEQAKIASLSFVVAPIPPWAALSELGSASARHFYYDAPPQTALQSTFHSAFQEEGQSESNPHRPKEFRHQSMVGIGAAVEYSGAGDTRFSDAQAFIDFWRSHFCIAQPIGQAIGQITNTRDLPPGYFFCSATFASDRQPNAFFAPAYVCVPALQINAQRQSSLITFNRLITRDTHVESVAEEIYRQLRQVIAIGDRAKAWPQTGTRLKSAQRHQLIKDVVGFEDTVRAVLHQMRSQPVHKVVISDVADVVMPSPVDVVRSLQTLRRNHPHCTTFSVGNGKGQSFIGASPERLLRIANGELMTDALAGTTSRSTDRGLDIQLGQSLLNSKKERYEHHLVVEFILDQLRSLGLHPNYDSSPHLLKLSNLQHLHTPIKATLKGTPKSAPIQPLDILTHLHPTPAVAGVPRQLACQLIRQHETFNRGLYTAPIGWVDTAGNSEFIVGIRSALIDGSKARLYAGAGIVSGSEPERELAEIRLKLQALLNALVVCE